MATTPGGDRGEGKASPPSAASRFYDALGHVAGLILALMAFAVFVQVVFRYLGFAMFDGVDEIPRFLFVWLVMIGAASAMWRHEHTILDYFIQRMPARLRSATVILTNAIAIGLFVWLIQLSWTLVPNANLQTSAGLELPLGWVFAAMPVGAALIIVPMLRNIWNELRRLWQRSS
jgi:TRAP-type C4-dicarboxylate transport system permease small subunit